MASFTEEIVNFNPYISQIPESYHQVGLIRQQQYDAGVQQVQSYISSVAGLEVMKGVHKDYLNARVTELTTQLNQAAPTIEFGDQTFVNQVGGYATRIASDPIIQNAVAATAIHKKNLGFIEEARKKGDDTTRNEWDYYNQLNEWMGDGDIKSSFNGRFSPVVDVMGKFYEAFKAAHPSSNLTQDAFRIGNDGKIQLNEAMEQLSIEGISVNTVQNIANLVFNQPDVKNQLRIDGRYSFRGYDQAALAEHVRANYQAAIDDANKDLQDMRTLMATDDSVNKVELSKQMEDRREAGARLVKDYKEYAALISTNPEAAKVALYENNLKSNLMNSFAWTKRSQTIVDNPLFAAKYKVLEYNLSLAKFDWQKEMDVKNLQLKEDELRLKKEGKLDPDGNPTTFTQPGNIEDVQGNVGEGSFTETLNSTKKSIAEISNKYVNMIAREAGRIPPKTLVDGNYIWNVGKGAYATQADAERAYNDVYKHAEEAYQNGTAKQEVNAFMKEVDPLKRKARNMENTMAKINAETAPDIQKFLKDVPAVDITYRSEDGRKSMKVSPQDMVDLVSIELNRSAFQGVDDEKLPAWNRLSKKYGAEEAKRILSAVRSSDNRDASKAYIQVKKLLKDNKDLEGAVQAREQRFKDAQLAFEPMSTAFIANDAKKRSTINTIFVETLTALGGENIDRGEISDLLEWTVDDKGEGVKIAQNTYGFYYDRFSDKVFLTIKRGDEVRSTEIPKDMAKRIPGVSLEDNFWNIHGADLGFNGNTTTNVPIDGYAPGELTAYPIDKVPGSQYSVKYHLTGDGEGKYSMQIYVRDSKGKPILNGASYNPPTLNALMTQEQVMTAIKTLQSDLVIEGLIKKSTNTSSLPSNTSGRGKELGRFVGGLQ